MKKPSEVLQEPEDAGYPVDYLLARLKGRRTHLIADWERYASAPSPPLPERYAAFGGRREQAARRFFQGELHWLYGQMEPSMRDAFRDVFIYFELKTVFSCVRYSSMRESREAKASLLGLSLLSRELKDTLIAADSPASALRAVEDAFSSLGPEYSGIAARYGESGMLIEAETRLAEAFLQGASRRAKDPHIRAFFSLIIDLRNITAAYKRLRWETGEDLHFVQGGSIMKGDLLEADEVALRNIVRRLTGLMPERTADMDVPLLKSLLARTRRAAREASSTGLVLHYILGCYREARNLGVLFGSAYAGGEPLREALVL